ncbi:hypothetical protein Agub_g4845, partial [Astrephomene gubernaculifera]
MVSGRRSGWGYVWALIVVVHMATSRVAASESRTRIETPWPTQELLDKDRTEPWVSYESSSYIGVHFLTAPPSIAGVLKESAYTIQGKQDPAYTKPQPPTSVSYRSRVLFAQLLPSANYLAPMRHGYHAFLQLPSPLRDGVNYTVSVSAGPFGAARSFLLAVNERSQLNTNIRVNQVGYPLTGPKLGFLGAWLGCSSATPPYAPVALKLPGGAGATFNVRDAVTGAVVFTGTPQLFAPPVTIDNTSSPASPDLYTGQRVWLLDFSALTAPGRYHIHMARIGVSHAFLVASDALRPVLGALARGVYGQRCGTALQEGFLGPWARTREEECHADDAEVMPVRPPPKWFTDKMPLPNPTPNMTTLPLNSSTGSYFLPQPRGGSPLQAAGGHHDAGDYGKYVVN